MLRLKLYLCFLPLLAYATQGPPLYQLQDLKILEAEKNYLEFFEHARDIPPGSRNEEWQNMVTSMGESFASQARRNKQLDEATFQLIEKLYTWPILKNDEFFSNDRNAIGKNYLEQCFALKTQNKIQCIEKLLTFWRKDPNHIELGIALAEILRDQMGSQQIHQSTSINQKIEISKSYHFQLFEFYRPALKSSISEFTCAKPHIQKFLINEFYQIAINSESSKIKQFQGELHPDCWSQLKKSFMTAIHNNTQDKELAYLILAGLKEMDETTETIYLTTYLLDSPAPGELFNLAWGRIIKLGKNKRERDQILDQIKKMDPLPDQLFGSSDQVKQRSIARLFNDYFPEYVDLYTKACLDFLTGTRNFANGNPTMNCRKYYELSKEQKLLLPGLETNFKQAFQI